MTEATELRIMVIDIDRPQKRALLSAINRVILEHCPRINDASVMMDEIVRAVDAFDEARGLMINHLEQAIFDAAREKIRTAARVEWTHLK